MVGRYGIPKYGSVNETPFDKQRFLLYQRHFHYCTRSAEVFNLLQRTHAYMHALGGERVRHICVACDQWMSHDRVPDVIKRKLSYIQHIYLSNTQPKGATIGTPRGEV